MPERDRVEDGIQLSDVIQQVRHELSRANWAGEHADVRFAAESVELELTVALERSTEPGVKVKLWVVEADGSHSRRSAVTQRITVRLRPHPADAPAEEWEVAGAAMPGER